MYEEVLKLRHCMNPKQSGTALPDWLPRCLEIPYQVTLKIPYQLQVPNRRLRSPMRPW